DKIVFILREGGTNHFWIQAIIKVWSHRIRKYVFDLRYLFIVAIPYKCNNCNGDRLWRYIIDQLDIK
ncbi:MAG: hypothetical protein ABF767_07705, partial [Lentilactobacillus hilgardii]